MRASYSAFFKLRYNILTQLTAFDKSTNIVTLSSRLFRSVYDFVYKLINCICCAPVCSKPILLNFKYDITVKMH